MKTSDSKYARKRKSGKMMYGPTQSQPKYPYFVKHRVPPDEYWWGEPRKSIK